jgi:murein DD-endopeptidase MepM/ murein hydrolase activator NlpD
LISAKVNNLDQISRYLYQISSLSGNADQQASPPNYSDSSKADTLVEMKPQVFQHFVKNEQAVSFPNISPVEGWITRQYLPDSTTVNLGHQGLDFAAASGTSVKATAPGVVAKIENDKYFGLLVTILHDNGFVTKYGHCSQVLVSKHDRVDRGQTIALVGNTGRSTAPHLHYEVLKDGKNIDPSKFILFHNE